LKKQESPNEALLHSKNVSPTSVWYFPTANKRDIRAGVRPANCARSIPT
jgi:hypothetical protein